MYFPLCCLDAVASGEEQLDKEPVQAQRRSSLLEENRRDTLIASETSLVTDSIIRGEGIAGVIVVCLHVQHACTRPYVGIK